MEEFSRGAIKREDHVFPRAMACRFAGLGDEGQGLIRAFQIGGETALITHISRMPGIMQRLFQRHEDF